MENHRPDDDWIRLFDWAELLSPDALRLLADIAEHVVHEDIFAPSHDEGPW